MANLDTRASSSNTSAGVYQVFLNFCGRDTRDFAKDLHRELKNYFIYGFIDEEELRVGEEFDGELLRAIDNSQIYIPIFSENYADSKWCLRELKRMVDNIRSSKEKKILPIFYSVKPDDVDLKTPLYKTAIEKHKEEYEKKFPHGGVSWEGEFWKDALKKVDKIMGWELKKRDGPRKLMRSVVTEVFLLLKIQYKTVTPHLVGFDGPVADIRELLDVNISDVRFLVLYGIGGIGKTTLAKVIFNELSSCFGKYYSFLNNVRETSKMNEGLLLLQKKLLTTIVGSESAGNIYDVAYGKRRIEETLGRMKVLIVLDDVDDEKQIEDLMGQGRLCPGTRIIITTRNKSVVKKQRRACEMEVTNSEQSPEILLYEMTGMNDDDALELFTRHASLKGSLEVDFDELARKIVNTTGGLPLALEVIGAFLYGRDKAIWKEALDELRLIPNEKVEEKLMISYEALQKYERKIFLDVACFLIDEDVINAIDMWTDCKFFPNLAIDVLVSMSLIKIRDNKFWMHDQLRNLGRDIVRRRSPKDLGKRSRLWTSEEENLGKQSRIWTTEEVLDFVRTKEMIRKYGTHLRLKSLALVKCHCLTRTPDLSGCLTLERLTFDDCGRLKEIDSSIGMLRCLRNLNIIHCFVVEQVPGEIGRLVKLEHFCLTRCHKVHELPTSIGNLVSLRKLDLSVTGIRSLPDSIGKLKSLCILRFSFPNFGMDEIDIYPWELPKAIGMLDKLEELHLSGHKKLVGEIPNEIGHLSSLSVLSLSNTGISRVPRTINLLSCLSKLDLEWCDEITELPELPTSLVYFLVKSRSLQMVPNLSKLTNLVELELSDASFITHSSNLKHKCDLRWIGRLSKLKKLDLCLLNIAVPSIELGLLSLLKDLTLLGLDLQPLKQLPPSLLSLELDNFSLTGSPQSNLEIPSNLRFCYSRLQEIQLYGFLKLQHLVLDNCDLQSLSIQSSIRTLKVHECPNMIEIQFLGLSASLEELKIHSCGSIGRIVLCGEGGSLGVLDQSESSSSGSIYCSPGVLLPNASKKLKSLELALCKNLLEIQVVGTLLLLQDISIYSCDAMEKFGVSNLKNLRHLVINNCLGLRVVEGLEQLESMTKLDVTYCHSLETLLDILNSKIPDECLIRVTSCGDSLIASPEDPEYIPFKRYKEMAQQGAPQSETNEEEAQSQFHPSESSRDHEISEPSIYNDREGLDELAPPRTFCDRFKICLVSILACVCNRDFPYL